MNRYETLRRTLVGGMVGATVTGLPRAWAATPALPSSPVALNFVDVAGNLALTQKAIEAYAAKNPKLVSKVSFSKAPAPELPGKIKAQQSAGRVDIDGVLTGIDVLSAGIEQKLWTPLLPDFSDKLPKLENILLPSALKLQAMAANQGVCIVYCPAGPLLEYMPAKVPNPPTSPQELLAWAKANPN